MKIKTDNVLNDLTTYEDYKFNTIITDPPYNLGSKWFIDKDGTYQIKGSKTKDFMNKWDGLDGQSLDKFFKECYRVMKYGGYLLMFGMDRQLGPLHYYATKNGFEINQSLYWYFVMNFPKSVDASKMIKKRIDKKGGDENLSKVFEGYKYSKAPLKQVVETIMVFSKPTKNKSVLDDLLEWGENVDLLIDKPKVNKKERNMGLGDEEDKQLKGYPLDTKMNNRGEEIKPYIEKNIHPTLKPINLIYEISKLFKLPDIVDQQVYVPFSGTGSELIGLLKAGYNHKNIYACEINKEYVDMSKKRIKYWHDTNIT